MAGGWGIGGVMGGWERRCGWRVGNRRGWGGGVAGGWGTGGMMGGWGRRCGWRVGEEVWLEGGE